MVRQSEAVEVDCHIVEVSEPSATQEGAVFQRPSGVGTAAESLASVSAAARGASGSHTERSPEAFVEDLATLESVVGDGWSRRGQGLRAGNQGLGNGAVGEGVGQGPATGGIERPHGPRLVKASAHCSSFFPFDAPYPHADVMLDVEVDEGGHPRGLRVLRSSRPGFSKAAEACARHLLFQPATDAAGHSQRGHATLTLVFDRPG